MPFTIPNAPSATYADQAEPDSVDFATLIGGHDQTGVVSGCAVSAQGTPNMTVAVGAGTAAVQGAPVAVTSGNLTIGAADATNARFDMIVVDGSGTKSVIAGTAAANPIFTPLPVDGEGRATSALLAVVYVSANATTITTGQITDKRVMLRYRFAGNVGLVTAPSYGYHQLGGSAKLERLSSPVAPTVMPSPTGSTTYGYYVIARDRNTYRTMPSPTTTITNGPATLGGGNQNTVSWSPISGAVDYLVIRSAGGAAQGLIATVVAPITSVVDTGLTASAYGNPTFNETADFYVDGSLYTRGPQPWADVRAWGAKGDDATDDTAAFQAAINAVSGYGGIVFIPPGVYRVSSLTIGQETTIMGSGEQTAIIKTTSATANVITVNAQSVYIMNVRFDTAVTRTAGSYVLCTSTAYDALIERCWFLGHFVGVTLNGTVQRVLHCQFLNSAQDANAAGVVSDGGTAYNGDHYIQHCVMSRTDAGSNAGCAIRVETTGGLMVSNTEMIYHTYAMRIKGGHAFQITDCYFDTCDHGLYIDPAGSGTQYQYNVYDVYCANCRFGGMQNNGAFVGQTNVGATTDSVEFHGCYWTLNNQSGTSKAALLINGGKNVRVVGGCINNTLKNGGTVGTADQGAGIEVASGVGEFSIIGVRSGNANPTPFLTPMPNRYGILIAAGASDNFTIIGCDLRGNTTANLSNGATGANYQIFANLPTAITNALVGTFQVIGDPQFYPTGATYFSRAAVDAIGNTFNVLKNRNGASLSANDVLMDWLLYGRNSAAADVVVSEILSTMATVTAGSEAGTYTVRTRAAGTLADRLWVDSAGGLNFDANGAAAGGIGLLSKNTAPSSAIASTAVETNFSINYVLPANALVVGRTIRITAWGTYGTTTVAPTLIIRLKAGATVLCLTPTWTTIVSTANRGWRVEAEMICITTGVSGTVEVAGQFSAATGVAGATTNALLDMPNTGVITLNTTVTQQLQLSAQWGTSNAANTIIQRGLLVEVLD